MPAARRTNRLLGINNRDLATQRIDLATAERVADLVTPVMAIVAESGIKAPPDVERMYTAGARALLVGEVLLRSSDPAATIRKLFNVSAK